MLLVSRSLLAAAGVPGIHDAWWHNLFLFLEQFKPVSLACPYESALVRVGVFRWLDGVAHGITPNNHRFIKMNKHPKTNPTKTPCQ